MAGDGAGDSFTETTSTGWLSRLGGALVGVLIGLVLVPGAAALLFWNEGRAVQTARSLTEGAGLVLGISAERLDPAHEGALVHATGAVRVAALPRDPDFAVMTPEGTLRLQRRVEMYQWREEQQSETRTKLGGGTETVTTYRYTRVWQEGRIDSARFRQADSHANPEPRHASRSWTAPGTRLGAFRLTEAQLADLPATEAIAPPGGTAPEALYLNADPGATRIGDLRITWFVARPEAVSIIAAQRGDGFLPYPTRAGDSLFMLEPGRRLAADMFRAAEESNVVLTWALRLGGVVLMLVGFLLVLNPLKVLADVVPMVGAIVGFGTGLLALVLTLAVAPLVIGIAWLFYRPLIGAGIILAGVVASFALSRLRRRKPAVAGAA